MTWPIPPLRSDWTPTTPQEPLPDSPDPHHTADGHVATHDAVNELATRHQQLQRQAHRWDALVTLDDSGAYVTLHTFNQLVSGAGGTLYASMDLTYYQSTPVGDVVASPRLYLGHTSDRDAYGVAWLYLGRDDEDATATSYHDVVLRTATRIAPGVTVTPTVQYLVNSPQRASISRIMPVSRVDLFYVEHGTLGNLDPETQIRRMGS